MEAPHAWRTQSPLRRAPSGPAVVRESRGRAPLGSTVSIRVAWRAVQVAGLGDEAAAVIGDIEPGDRIVALGAHLLHEGESVLLTEGAGAQHAAIDGRGRP